MAAVLRQDITLGGEVAAWLWHPEGARGCVVLGHGLSAVRDQRIDAYAERFAEAGLAALLFDYRHFGASGGQPRQLLDIKRQLEDWRTAVAYARGLDGVERSACSARASVAGTRSRSPPVTRTSTRPSPSAR